MKYLVLILCIMALISSCSNDILYEEEYMNTQDGDLIPSESIQNETSDLNFEYSNASRDYNNDENQNDSASGLATGKRRHKPI